MQQQKLFIFDRDGILNRERGDYVTCLAEFVLIPEALAVLAALKQQGHLIAIATNQAGIDKQRYSRMTLLAIHAHLLKQLRAQGGDVDGFLYAASSQDHDPFRKPNPGMLLALMQQLNCTAANTYFIGDSARDLQAAQAAGCTAILSKSQKLDGRAEFATILTAAITNDYLSIDHLNDLLTLNLEHT